MLSMVFLYFLSSEDSQSVTQTLLLVVLFFLTLSSMFGAAGTIIHRDKREWVGMYRITSVCTVVSFYILVGGLIGYGYTDTYWDCENPNQCKSGEIMKKWWKDPWNCWYAAALCCMTLVGIFSCCWSRSLSFNEEDPLSTNIQSTATSEIDLLNHQNIEYESESEGSITQ